MDTQERTGFAHGVLAYALWGLFPLYFTLFWRSSALEVVAHRIVWSLLLCLVILLITGRLDQLRTALSHQRSAMLVGGAGLLVGVNWTLYVHGVNTGRTLDAAIGYFITPLVTTALGVVVLRERLRPLQWLAVGSGMVAMLILVLGHGQVPWIALGVAGSFGVYGLLKKQAGAAIKPVPGLVIETTVLLVPSLPYLALLGATGQASSPPLSWYTLLLCSTGVVGAAPLLLFASAAHRIPLVALGMIQHMAPSVQFLLGWLLFHEPVPPTRWIGFLFVLGAVVIFAIDALTHASRNRCAA